MHKVTAGFKRLIKAGASGSTDIKIVHAYSQNDYRATLRHSGLPQHKAMVLARYSITAQCNNLPCTCCLAYSRPSTHNKLPQHFLCKFSRGAPSPASFSKSLTRVTSHPPQFHLAVAGRSFFLARSTHCRPLNIQATRVTSIHKYGRHPNCFSVTNNVHFIR